MNKFLTILLLVSVSYNYSTADAHEIIVRGHKSADTTEYIDDLVMEISSHFNDELSMIEKQSDEKFVYVTPEVLQVFEKVHDKNEGIIEADGDLHVMKRIMSENKAIAPLSATERAIDKLNVLLEKNEMGLQEGELQQSKDIVHVYQKDLHNNNALIEVENSNRDNLEGTSEQRGDSKKKVHCPLLCAKFCKRVKQCIDKIPNICENCVLAGEVTGPLLSNVVTAAVSTNTPNAIVRRDATGSFAAQNINAANLNASQNISALQNVTVGGNINLTQNPSTATAGNILKNGVPFIHNAGSTFNTFVGLNAGNFTLTGLFNTALGNLALNTVSTGAGNTAVGTVALQFNNTGRENTAVGNGALIFNTSGFGNTAIGQTALRSNNIGNRNTATGQSALFSSTGDDNTVFGHNIMSTLASGNANTALGRNAFGGLPSGSENIGVGALAGNNLTGASNNNIYIGTRAVTGVTAENNRIRIGQPVVVGQTAHTDCYIQGIYNSAVTDRQVFVQADGKLGTNPPIAQDYIQDIQPLTNESDKVIELKPISFTYKKEYADSGSLHYGLLAEDVAKITPELVSYSAEGKPQEVRYQMLIPLLLNEMRKMKEENQAHSVTIEQLKKQFAEFLAQKSLKNHRSK